VTHSITYLEAIYTLLRFNNAYYGLSTLIVGLITLIIDACLDQGLNLVGKALNLVGKALNLVGKALNLVGKALNLVGKALNLVDQGLNLVGKVGQGDQN
jgi:hypothetical protein